jgi:glycosyltransferase involved in cell wall biosynthesis
MCDSTEKPQIAVVIPVYRARYLRECLDSVMAQTHLPDEVIVVDDGSPDAGLIELATAPHAGRLRLIRQENRGAGAARNLGILCASAELIAFLDADDVWCPTFLEDQTHRLAEAPDCTLVYANATLVGDGPLPGRLFMDLAPSSGDVTVDALLSQRCTVLTSSVLVRRSALVNTGLFDEELRRGQDFDLWVRLAHSHAHFAYTTEPLLARRIHSHNLSGDRITELERAMSVLRKLSTKLTFTDSERQALDTRVRVLESNVHAEHGKRSLRTGDIAAAQARFARAAECQAEWKARAVQWALRLAPGLTRRAYLFKTRRQSATAFSAVTASGG